MHPLHQPQDYVALMKSGLPQKSGERKKVIIIGAGMAGLAAAELLLRAGHDPVILEAQQRVGGRIYTLRAPFAPGLYGEAGAMRIPLSHQLTMAYIEKFKLNVSPFIMNNVQAYNYISGQLFRIADCNTNPDSMGFEIGDHERGKTAGQLWEAALAPITSKLNADGEAAWEEIIAEYDQYSVREFLELNRWSEGAIEMFGLLFNQEALMNSSFLELLREEIGECYVNMVQIDGGMDNLPQAFLPVLQNRIRFGVKVVAIDQTPDEAIIHFRTPTGRGKIRGDFAILTVPTPVLRHIEVLKPFSRPKQRAIRQVHYDASAKVFIQCRRRFWEEDEGIYGGGTITDLAVRNIYYPEHGRETGRGVLLASYTWSEDAQRWGSLSPEQRIEQAIENVALIHPQILEEAEGGTSKMWHDDEFACGAFALFDPGQQTLLYEHLISPEGRFHFAGEHASLTHAWIQGAIESGLRAAWEVHSRI